MSLPAAWVEKLFAKLTVTYGRDFSARWEGLDPDAVKADWAETLGGYVANPDAIGYALEHLPADKPPTVLSFAEICRRAPVAAPLALPAPPPDPEIAKTALSAIKRMNNRSPGDRSWAHRLKDREERNTGSRLTQFQRDAWREALAMPASQEGEA